MDGEILGLMEIWGFWGLGILRECERKKMNSRKNEREGAI